VSAKRVAIIQDWLTGMRGGEKVLEVLCDVFPQADIFTLVYLPGRLSPTIESHRIVTSPLQKIPNIGSLYRKLLPFMPWAIEKLDFSGYDLLISNSHCVAKAVKPAKGARHVCYCLTPMRYIWDQYNDYFGPGRASPMMRGAMSVLRKPLQRWDLRTLPRVNDFITDCKNIQERVRRIYNRDSPIIYPPVDYDFYSHEIRNPKNKDDFYLIVSALAPYKRVDIAIQAFQQLGRKLIVIGEGQESKALKKLAGPKIEFLGWRSNEELRSYYGTCRALIFPGEEDFGIVPVEANAAGCPVIAYRKGGALETITEDQTGIFFDDQTPQSVMEAVERFEKKSFDPSAISAQAERFSRQRCEAAFRSYFLEYDRKMS
jgi:glycosyltransferase involved in cell wall biosynthesis